MNIDELTVGQVKEIAGLVNISAAREKQGLSSMLGEWVIVRTYSAGVHFGKLTEKEGDEVIIEHARRLYFWKTNGGISLSEVALTGLHADSKVCAAVPKLWLQAIEIIPCAGLAINSITGISDYVN